VRTIARLLAFVCAGACAAPPARDVELPVTSPAVFSERGREELPDRWWLAFDDPALDRLVREALAGNLSLRIVWDRLRQAEAVARAAGAPLRPIVDGEAGAAAGRRRSREGGVRATRSETDLGLGIAASYEVDLWGRLRAGRDAAAIDAEASAEQVRAAAISLAATIASTWYALAERTAQVELFDRQIETNEQALELLNERFRRGRVPAADVLRQRQLVESTRGERVLVTADVRLLEHRLAVLLGRPPADAVTDGAERVLVEPGALPATGLPLDLVRRRPDLVAAHLAVASADRDLAAAIADRYPRLSLTGAVETNGAQVNELFKNWLANLAAGLVAPLLDGGARRAEVDRRRAIVSERLHAYGQATLDAFREVEDALVAEERQRAFLASLDVQLELAVDVVARVRERYGQGDGAFLDVLDATVLEQALRRRRVAAHGALVGFRIDLYRALAGGWPLAPPDAGAEEENP
jgi:NodT family efflux transporter outer membrane factor (OMF) lipoprotein